MSVPKERSRRSYAWRNGSPSAYPSLDSLDSLEGLGVEHPPAGGLLARGRFGRVAKAVYPGLAAAIVVALAATWLAQHYGAPVMLFALLIGMAFHFLNETGRCYAGIQFASRSVLRLGVALLGARITAEQVASLGAAPVLTVVVGVASTIALGLIAARWFGLPRVFGVLSGGAVAICGASAALAISSVLGRKHREVERDTIIVVVAVTALSTLAMIVYPMLSNLVGLDNVHAGVFLGGSIHDVAQVVGAGYMVSQKTGDVATYVKLLRVAMLAPVVLLIILFSSRAAREADGKRSIAQTVPPFLIGFIGLAVANSLGLLPPPTVAMFTSVSQWCLVVAIAALGIKTSLGDIVKVGWRPVALLVIETAWIGALVFCAVRFLM